MIKKTSAKTSIPKTVDEYLARVPEDQRAALEKLRKTIRATAPQAAEVISYQMPMYKHHGMLVGFAAFKNHCSLFAGSGVMEDYEEELENYKTSKGTIQFTIAKPLPATLVKKLVKARIKHNEANAARKKR